MSCSTRQQFHKILDERNLRDLYSGGWSIFKNGDLVINSNGEPRCKFCGELLEGRDHFEENDDGQIDCPEVISREKTGFFFFKKVEENGKTYIVSS